MSSPWRDPTAPAHPPSVAHVVCLLFITRPPSSHLLFHNFPASAVAFSTPPPCVSNSAPCLPPPFPLPHHMHYADDLMVLAGSLVYNGPSPVANDAAAHFARRADAFRVRYSVRYRVLGTPGRCVCAETTLSHVLSVRRVEIARLVDRRNLRVHARAHGCR